MRAARKAGGTIDRTVRHKLGGWGNVATGGLLGLGKGIHDAFNPDFDFPDPAMPAPDAQFIQEDTPTPEMGDGRTGSSLRSRRRGRSSLRIGLNVAR